MKRFATLRNARLLQLFGLLVAVAGLGGFWLTRDVPRSQLTPDQAALINPESERFQASFVVAGKDVFYSRDEAEPIYGEGGRIVGWDFKGYSSVEGTNTDTILYVNIVGDEVTLIAIPRDIYLPKWQTRINAMYAYQEAEGLKRSVEELLSLPIDYYAIINLDIFENLVDALGGVEVNVPYRMHYVDNAGGLYIHFEPGLTTLDGDDAARFVRYRNTARGDFDRLDNVKMLAGAMLRRLQQLNVRAVARIPELADTFFSDVETNASPLLVPQLLPRLGRLRIQSFTLPTEENYIEGFGAVLDVNRQEVERFLAATFGGTPRLFTDAPEATLLITNRSGQPGLEAWYRERLMALGVPSERVLVREASLDPAPTRMLVTAPFWEEADYYTRLLHTAKQQVDRLTPVSSTRIDLELVLGADAASTPPGQLAGGSAAVQTP